MPTRASLAVETKGLLFLWLAHLNNKSNVCKQIARFSIECRKQLANYFGFAILHSVIGSKLLRHYFNQPEVKQKPIVVRLCTFSRTFCRLRVITSSFDWFTGLSPSFLIGQSNTLVLVLRHSIETRSIFPISDQLSAQSVKYRWD